MNDSREQIRAVTFDAYGTLLRLDRPFERLREELARIGLRVPMETVTKVFLQEMTFYRAHHLEGNNPDNLLGLRFRCAELLFRLLAQEGYWAKLSEEQYLHVLMSSIRLQPYDDALPVLKWCLARGLATGVVSNWDCSLAATLKGAYPHNFSCVMVSAVEGVEKSDLRLFLKAAQCLNVPPSHIVHIGDEEESDLHGAERAGLRAVLLDREGEYRKTSFRRISHLGEFPGLCEKAFTLPQAR
jgi:HAD superfamily hydrolase (TIGR01549 family)